MKACGISLYRASLSVIVLSLGLQRRHFQPRAESAGTGRTGKPRSSTPRFGAARRGSSMPCTGSGCSAGRARFTTIHISTRSARSWLPCGFISRRPTAGACAPRRRPSARSTRVVGSAIRYRTADFSAGKPRWMTYAERPLNLEPPNYFETEQPVAEMMTVGELRRYVNELSASGLNVAHLAVELQRKMAFPFVTLVMTLLAIPFGVGTGRRGALYAVGLGIILALSYWIVTQPVRRPRQERASHAVARRLVPQHHRLWRVGLPVPDGEDLILGSGSEFGFGVRGSGGPGGRGSTFLFFQPHFAEGQTASSPGHGVGEIDHQQQRRGPVARRLLARTVCRPELRETGIRTVPFDADPRRTNASTAGARPARTGAAPTHASGARRSP